MPKKILIFSLAYYPSFVSGAEAAIKEITDRIDSKKIQFHMVTLLFDKTAPRYELIGNVHVHRVGFGGAYLSKILFIPLSALKARSLWKSEGIDAVWAMMTYMLVPLTIARFLGVRLPYMLTLQDGDPYEKVFGRWFIKPALPLIDTGFKKARVIQVISDYLGTWPALRGSTSRVCKIYNGGNPRDFDPTSVSQTDLQQLKQKLGKREGEVWLVNTARLVHQKAFDDTIRALTKLPDHVRFLIVGGGGDEQMLRDLVKELKLEDRVVFAGAVDRSEVTAYRRAADIFVMPSRSEGLGNAGLSAMASGLPFVGTTEGGLSEYVFNLEDQRYGKTGWVVEKDSPEQIAKAVTAVMADPDEARRVTSNARTMVKERYHWDSIAVSMEDTIFSQLWTS